MNKSELTAAIADSADITKADATKALNGMMDRMLQKPIFLNY